MSELRPYDPQSPDAMFSRIIARLDAQDEVLKRIEGHVVKTNGRVSVLERWRDVVTTKAATVSAGVAVAAWLLERFLR